MGRILNLSALMELYQIMKVKKDFTECLIT